jgi:hypothetical protein
LLDPISGKIYEYVGKYWGVRENAETAITKLPLTDYPLILTEYEAVKSLIDVKK